MYAAAKAKPPSIEVEHLGPAPMSGPHLVATYKPGREIYAQGDLNDKCYQVSTGAVRIYRLLSDGRRQVVSFHLPGEMFGFEAGSNHSFFAEAITEKTLAIFGRRNMQERSRELLALALTGMARAQQHLLVIGRQCAVERIAVFLVDLCERQSGGRQLRLPMSRQDIADYLGLTIETVSLMSSMRDGEGFRVPPDAVRSFEDRAAGARRRLAANARVSDERQRLHMPPARGDHAYDIVRHFVGFTTQIVPSTVSSIPDLTV